MGPHLQAEEVRLGKRGLGLASSLVEVEPVGAGADFENCPLAASALIYVAVHRAA